MVFITVINVKVLKWIKQISWIDSLDHVLFCHDASITKSQWIFDAQYRLQQCDTVCVWSNPFSSEGCSPRGFWEPGPQGQGGDSPAVAMVIDAGTIQMAQTLQQIKRLFCKVVKELNGRGEGWDSGILPQVFCHAINFCWVSWVSCPPLFPLRKGSCQKPFTLTHSVFLMLLMHMWDYVWRQMIGY